MSAVTGPSGRRATCLWNGNHYKKPQHEHGDEGYDPFANAAWWGPAEMLNYAKPDDHYRDACHVSE